MAQVGRKANPVKMESLVDKAERYVEMQGLTAREAGHKVIPEDLWSIDLGDLRDLVGEGVGQRVNSRIKDSRTRDSERTALLTRKRIEDALSKQAAVVQKRAEVLARVRYAPHGQLVNLLDMSMADHRVLLSSSAESERTHAGRKRFHAAAVKSLREGKADSIAALLPQRIVDLALIAEEVWG